MTDLLTTLVPLAVASAVTPVQVAVVVLMLQSEGGLARATGLVGGMTVVRLAQGMLFGLVLGVGDQPDGADDGIGPVGATLLLLVAVFFIVSAIRKLLKEPDEDAPPPKWMAAVQAARPVQAALLGAGYVGLSPKLWAFTLGAIGAIEGAELAPTAAVITFLLFVAGAQATHLLAIAGTAIAPAPALRALAGVSSFLQRWDRAIMVSLGLGFGVLLLVKALIGLEIL